MGVGTIRAYPFFLALTAPLLFLMFALITCKVNYSLPFL
jgi:hypothetical protein